LLTIRPYGNDPESDSVPVKAHTKIVHDIQHPSFLDPLIVRQSFVGIKMGLL